MAARVVSTDSRYSARPSSRSGSRARPSTARLPRMAARSAGADEREPADQLVEPHALGGGRQQLGDLARVGERLQARQALGAERRDGAPAQHIDDVRELEGLKDGCVHTCRDRRWRGCVLPGAGCTHKGLQPSNMLPGGHSVKPKTLQMVDLAGDAGRAEAVVDVHHGHARRARVQHARAGRPRRRSWRRSRRWSARR